MKYQKIKGVKHYVFDSIPEFQGYFRSLNLQVPQLITDWRKGEEGDWVIADDGGIVQILKRARTQYGWHYVRTVVGTFRQDKYYEMDTDFSLHPNRYSFSGKNNREVRKFRKELTKNEADFVLYLIMGLGIKEAFRRSFGTYKNWKARALELMREERIMRELRAATKEAASKLNLNLEFIMKGLMDLTQEGVADNVRLGALKELKEWLEAIEETSGYSYLESNDPLSGVDISAIEEAKVKALDG
jgi:hypothetical protein